MESKAQDMYRPKSDDQQDNQKNRILHCDIWTEATTSDKVKVFTIVDVSEAFHATFHD